ncbi:unnamed protein product [Schistosoma mattheei]|uniref:Uncharacterized protein n=1 Tax=Schistosoma mattheei TaxID=31246 RepID=A0A183PW52_9TREM|nr:unnamed protein product [Schistosoma mattheei]
MNERHQFIYGPNSSLITKLRVNLNDVSSYLTTSIDSHKVRDTSYRRISTSTTCRLDEHSFRRSSTFRSVKEQSPCYDLIDGIESTAIRNLKIHDIL